MTETSWTDDDRGDRGRAIRVSRSDEPIDETRPSSPAPTRLTDRIVELMDRGVLVPPAAGHRAIQPLAFRPGALDRFESEREA